MIEARRLLSISLLLCANQAEVVPKKILDFYVKGLWGSCKAVWALLKGLGLLQGALGGGFRHCRSVERICWLGASIYLTSQATKNDRPLNAIK